MAESSRRLNGASSSGDSTCREALAALQFWQVLEYLSPQKPPKPEIDKGTCNWALNPLAEGDAQMPWVAPAKMEALDKLFKPKRRYMLFAGVIGGSELVETTRSLLGAPEMNFSEQRAPADAASFVIPLDERGVISGDVFVSAVPWAIACIQSAMGSKGMFDFSGFFGEGGVQQQIKVDVNALLKQRLLISDDAEGAVVDDAAPAGGADDSDDASLAQEDGAQSADDAAYDGASMENVQPHVRALEAEDIRAIADVVFQACGWRPAVEREWIIQTLRAPKKNQDKAPDDPLNSFYAEELENIQSEYLAGSVGATLAQFLEAPIHAERCDLESSRQYLVDGVHPSLTPHACWPGEFPLVTAQQFAVNAILRDLQDGGLFSVNGPPGTGKTTMLKDILAAIAQERADVLASFDDPLAAFPRKLVIEGHRYPVWQLHDKLRGFGIVVACANNGAAENISKELPSLASVDQKFGLDYFSEVADSIGVDKDAKQRQPRRWGLISAALGKQENRLGFVTDFWEGRKSWDKKKQVRGTPLSSANQAQPSEAEDPMRLLTLQDWVATLGSQVPTWAEARQRYAEAKRRAEAALERAGTLASLLRTNEELAPQLAALHSQQAQTVARLAELQQQEQIARSALADARSGMEQAKLVVAALEVLQQHRAELQCAQDGVVAVRQQMPRIPLQEVTEGIARVEQARIRIQDDLAAHQSTRPGAIAAFFKQGNLRRWTARQEQLTAELDAARQQLDALEQDKARAIAWARKLAHGQQQQDRQHDLVQSTLAEMDALRIDGSQSLDDAVAQARVTEALFTRCSAALQGLEPSIQRQEQLAQDCSASLQRKRDRFAVNAKALADAGLCGEPRSAWHLFDVSREEFHRASPYHDEAELFDARRALFAAAMELHKAFIVHSWTRLKPTLYATMGMLQGKIRPGQVHGGPMPLWDALFLVVPLVSTTFASFPRLFRGVGKEQLAWVLIDEAGQAAPQYCVGALWRARRAVIVGDPLQLEPVVGVPEELVAPMRERCGTDSRYVPPAASAQTLADLSNRYGMYLHEADPEHRIWLGSPLVVHRRCISPMFEIANAIAYEDKMVYGGGKDQLGIEVPYSRWLDAGTDGNEGHWVPEQGERVVNAIRKLVGVALRNQEGKLRIFVITPFSKVAEKMRDRLAADFLWNDVKEMCGTVHTFQGKEADYVIFLLGGDPQKPGVISSFAGKNPNLVNVAVTRAKKRLYVMGNRSHWTGRGDANGYYGHMAEALDKHLAGMKALQAVGKVVTESPLDGTDEQAEV